MSKNIAPVILALFASVSPAWADLTAERSAKLYLTDPAGKTRRINRDERLLIRNGNVKIVDETFGEIWIIRVDKKKVWKIDTVDGTYAEATFDEIVQKRKEVIDSIVEARKRVEGTADAGEIDEVLAGMGASAREQRVAVREFGSQEEIAGHSCRRTLILADDKQLINGWYAADLPEGGDFFKALAMIGGYAPAVAGKLAEVKGTPLKGDIRYGFLLDRVTATIETRKISTEALKDEDFDLPAGLTKTTLVELFGEPKREIKPREIKKDFPEDDLEKKEDPLHGKGS